MSIDHQPGPAPVKLRLEALTPALLGTFEEVLGAPEFGGCFCAVWTGFAGDWAGRCADPKRPNLEQTATEVRAGRPAGFLVRGQLESGEEAMVGWVGCGPKPHFPFFWAQAPGNHTAAEPDTWVLGCLTICARWRGHQLSGSIMELVANQAAAAGASRLEALPTERWSEPRCYRGSWTVYQRQGFREIARAGRGDATVLLIEKSLTAD